MLEIKFNVYGKRIINPKPYIVNKSKNYINFIFIFNTFEWIDIDKYIIFKNNEKKMIRYLGNECNCRINVPNELMMDRFIKFKIQGKDSDDEVILTKSLVIPLEKSGFTEDTFVYGGEN